MKIGIIGNGFVGKATALFATDFIKTVIYDKNPEKCEPYGATVADLHDCDFVFICVPTPMSRDGSCHFQIVESCVYELNTAGIREESIVVRSTVPVGFCDSVGVNFMPEFLTEANWIEDFKNNNAWVFGANSIYNAPVKSKFAELISLAKSGGSIKHDDVYFCSSKEAELCKLTRNSFLATKVSFFNEIYDFCENEDLDYNTVAELTGLDDRIGQSHTQVPGPDGKKGFGGTCFPKDLDSLYSQMNGVGMESYIIEAARSRNIQVDRPEQDWTLDKGRSVL
jgi:nucleotide sugar dehydrogenase